MSRRQPTPGAVRFSHDLSEEFFDQLVGERRRVRYVRNRSVVEFVPRKAGQRARSARCDRLLLGGAQHAEDQFQGTCPAPRCGSAARHGNTGCAARRAASTLRGTLDGNHRYFLDPARPPVAVVPARRGVQLRLNLPRRPLADVDRRGGGARRCGAEDPAARKQGGRRRDEAGPDLLDPVAGHRGSRSASPTMVSMSIARPATNTSASARTSCTVCCSRSAGSTRTSPSIQQVGGRRSRSPISVLRRVFVKQSIGGCRRGHASSNAAPARDRPSA